MHDLYKLPICSFNGKVFKFFPRIAETKYDNLTKYDMKILYFNVASSVYICVGCSDVDDAAS